MSATRAVGHRAADGLALACVVTAPCLPEFVLLKYSWELFEGVEYPWYIRCDAGVALQLRGQKNLYCHVVSGMSRHRVRNSAPEFNGVALHKMAAMGDAWRCASTRAVLLLDADLIVTDRTTPAITKLSGDVVLTPNYYPKQHLHLAPLHGYFNSGFVFTRSPEFVAAWRAAFCAQPWRFTDQACLNEVASAFRTDVLGPEANVGLWRSVGYPQMDFGPIPARCLSLHCHMYQPLRTKFDWVERMFGLHCLEYLLSSGSTDHRRIGDRILRNDPSGWYLASLRLREKAASACRPIQRVRRRRLPTASR